MACGALYSGGPVRSAVAPAGRAVPSVCHLSLCIAVVLFGAPLPLLVGPCSQCSVWRSVERWSCSERRCSCQSSRVLSVACVALCSRDPAGRAESVGVVAADPRRSAEDGRQAKQRAVRHPRETPARHRV